MKFVHVAGASSVLVDIPYFVDAIPLPFSLSVAVSVVCMLLIVFPTAIVMSSAPFGLMSTVGFVLSMLK